MDWPRKLRIMQKLAAPRDMWTDLEVRRGMSLAPTSAPATPIEMTNSLTGEPYRTPVARKLVMSRLAGRVGSTPNVAPATVVAPNVAAPTVATSAPAAPAAPLKMEAGKGYMWLASQINKGRSADQQVGWRDLRKAMGGQMLRAGKNYDYSSLRDLTPDAIKAKPEGKIGIGMPWHTDAASYRRDVAAGAKQRAARVARPAAPRPQPEVAAAAPTAAAVAAPSASAVAAAPAPAPVPAPVAAAPRATLPLQGMSTARNRFGLIPMRMLNPDARAVQERTIAALRAQALAAPAPS